MLALALDDEPIQLEVLTDAIRAARPSAQVLGFSNAVEAMRVVDERGLRPDVVFSDIEMPGMTGLELAHSLKERGVATNVVFVTGFDDYALEAYDLWASGYVMKPVDEGKVREQLDHLRFEVAHEADAPLRVQCFGTFEVFAQGRPLHFSRRRSKELLAYLVDRRGASCTTRELAAVLFENAPYDSQKQSYIQTIVSALFDSLASAGARDCVVRGYNAIALDTSKVDCDLYRTLDGNAAAAALFTGEYMAQYSWAEGTAQQLLQKL